MIARAATGRKKVVLLGGGYHGTAPWAQAPGHNGVIEDDYANYIRLKWNDFEAFKKAVDDNPGEIAGFMATPYHHPAFADNEFPTDNYWQKVQQW